jgi:uncharacterized membrane protein
MSDKQLVVLSLASEDSARDLVRQLEAIDKLDANVTIIDAAIAMKNRRGKVRLKQLKGAGAANGGVIGAIGGAFSGLTAIFRSTGIDEDMMRRTAEDLSAGEVALFLLYTGHWDRSSTVLHDALAAHGIGYEDNRRLESRVAAPSSSPIPVDVADSGGRVREFAPDEADENSPDKYVYEEPIFDEEPVYEEGPVMDQEAVFEEPVFDDGLDFPDEAELVAPVELDAKAELEPLPVHDVEATPEQAVESSEASAVVTESDPVSVVEPGDPVANAARRAIAAAVAETRASDSEAIGEAVGALSEVVAGAGETDVREGEEALDAAARIGDAGAHIGLLALERKYSGLEIGRIAGELAQIGREVGERDLPLLFAILANRSGMLQRIAAETIASAATARELAGVLDTTGGQVGELGAAEMEEGAARLAVASVLAAYAADIGAVQLSDTRETKRPR